jgi:asparagine synthase (glutamine-hydrolysing)
MIWHMDEPFASTSQYSQWNVMKRVAQGGVTVTLDGQGGDELLAGYLGYYGVWLTTLAKRGHWGQAVREARAIMELGGRGRSAKDLLLRTTYGILPFTIKMFLRDMAVKRLNGTSKEGHSLDVLRSDFRRRFAARRQQWLRQQSQNMQNFPQRLYEDIFCYSLPQLLRYEDRNSMAFSIEARTPFLDYRLVELILAMPAAMKVRGGWTKWVLRQAMGGILPKAIQWRADKKGFVTPEVIWLRQGEAQIRDLFSGSVLSAEFIDPNLIRDSLASFLAGKAEGAYYTEIWRWINLEMWMRCFFKN